MKLKTLIFLPFIFFGAQAMADDHAATLDTEQQQLSYIFGIQVGQNMLAEGVDLEMEAFSAGVADMFAGKQPQLDQATAEKIITAFQQGKAKEMAAEMNKKLIWTKMLRKMALSPLIVACNIGSSPQVMGRHRLPKIKLLPTIKVHY